MNEGHWLLLVGVGCCAAALLMDVRLGLAAIIGGFLACALRGS